MTAEAGGAAGPIPFHAFRRACGSFSYFYIEALCNRGGLHMKNATIKILLPNAFPTTKNRFLQRNSSSESEDFTSRFFIGLWRSCGRAQGSAVRTEATERSVQEQNRTEARALRGDKDEGAGPPPRECAPSRTREAESRRWPRANSKNTTVRHWPGLAVLLLVYRCT